MDVASMDRRDVVKGVASIKVVLSIELSIVMESLSGQYQEASSIDAVSLEIASRHIVEEGVEVERHLGWMEAATRARGKRQEALLIKYLVEAECGIDVQCW